MNLLDEALAHFQAATFNQPNVRLLTNIGKIHAAQGHALEARKSFLRALEVDPGFTIARFELAGVLSSLNLREEAVAQYRRALREEPLDASGRYGLAENLAALGLREEALAELRELLRLAPGQRKALVLLARLQAQIPPPSR
jgi:tetratricopeptide (TPR) repeat protein